MNTKTASGKGISAAVGRLIFDRIQEEWLACLALAAGARRDLAPGEGVSEPAMEHLVGFKLVQLLADRLEEAEFLDEMRQWLDPQAGADGCEATPVHRNEPGPGEAFDGFHKRLGVALDLLRDGEGDAACRIIQSVVLAWPRAQQSTL